MKKRMGCILCVFLLFIVFLVPVFFTSRSSLEFLAVLGEIISDDRLQVGGVDGSLFSTIYINDLSYMDNELNFSAQSLVLSWDFWKIASGVVEIKELSINNARYDYIEKNYQKRSSVEELSLPEISVPIRVKLNSAGLDNLIIAKEGETLLVLNRVLLQAEMKKSLVTVTDANVQTDHFSAAFSGTVDMRKKWPVDMTCLWNIRVDDVSIQGDLRIRESIQQGNVVFQVKEPSDVSIKAKYTIDKGYFAEAQISLKEVDPSIMIPELSGLIDGEALVTAEYGTSAHFIQVQTLDVSGVLNTIPFVLHGKGSYDGNAITVEDLNITSNNSHLRSYGLIKNDCDLVFQLEVASLTDFFPEGSGKIHGEGTVSGKPFQPYVTISGKAEEIILSNTHFGSVKLSGEGNVVNLEPLTIKADISNSTFGSVDIDKMEINGTGAIHDHILEFRVKEEGYEGMVALRGSLKEKYWRGEIIDMTVSHSDNDLFTLLEPSAVALTHDDIKLDTLCATNQNSRICLGGEYRQDYFNGELRLTAFDPGDFLKEWPGEIDLAIHGSMDLRNKNSTTRVIIDQLKGELKGKNLQGKGSVNLIDDEIYFNDIELLFGESYVTGDGGFGIDKSLEFSGKVRDFSIIDETMQGELDFQGIVEKGERFNAVQLDLEGRGLKYGDIQVGMVAASLDIGESKDSPIDVDVMVERVAVGTATLHDALLRASGSLYKHRFSLNLTTDRIEGKIEGQGRYSDSWKAVIENGKIHVADLGDFELLEQTSLTIDKETINIENLCIESNYVDGCIGLLKKESSEWAIEGGEMVFQLSTIDTMFDLKTEAAGEIGVDVNAIGAGEKIFGGNLTATSNNISFSREIEGEKVVQSLSIVDFTATIEDQLLRVDSSLNMGAKNKLHMKVEVDGADRIGKQVINSPVIGSAKIEFDDLSLISHLSSSRFEPTGRLYGNFEITGSFGKPALTGYLNLEDGTFNINDLGIALFDVDIGLNAKTGDIGFSVSAKSGEGFVTGNGFVSHMSDSGWNIESTISGENFEIVDIEEYHIIVDPDIRCIFNSNESSVEGKLSLPYARINKSGSDNAISPVSDVRIVDDIGDNEKRETPFFARVDVELGDDVKVSAYGLNGFLEGAVFMQREPGKTLAAHGELDVVDGSFSFYSASLDIVRGKILYTGGAIDNPGVDFRAQRVVDENRVGVHVGGSVNDLVFDLFSDPVMEQSDILSYLIAGRSLSSANENDRGQLGAAARAIGLYGLNSVSDNIGKFLPIDEMYLDEGSNEDISLVLGKYITRDIFIGYDHNFFDESGEFRIQYDLGSGFSLETRSSGQASSGDVFYTLER